MKINRIHSKIAYLATALALAASATSCGDEVADEAYYTFTGETVYSYSENNPELFSTFNRLVKDTGTNSLLATYGHYTCFMPDDDAFDAYFKSVGTTYEQLTPEQKSEIVYNHVIKSESRDYDSEEFVEGALSEPTMSDNYLVISYKTDASGSGLVIYVNKDVPILERDIEVHNGVVHHVGSVIQPTKDFIDDILAQMGQRVGKDFSIFSHALAATHLNDSVRQTYDQTYDPGTTEDIVNVGGYNLRMPLTKRLGYTLFAESDEVMAQNGIHSLDDLKAYAANYYSSESDDPTSPANSLHKFVAYHLLDRQMSTNTFLYNGKATTPNSARDRVEFYETMYTFHLLKINVNSALNRSERDKSEYIGLREAESNISAVNGYIHSLDKMLVYDTGRMENDVLNCRIRFDMFNVPSELTNNNIRWNLVGMEGDAVGYTIPHDFCKNIKFTEDTQITFWGSDYWDVCQADEMKLNGWYDFTLRLLPVPPGSYEVRVGYRPESWRGIAQFFIDGQIQGIPRDLRIMGSDPQVGWVADTGGPQDAENDKAMRNRGYMKAPASMWSNHDQCTLRDIKEKQPLRMIISTVNFQDYGEHFLRAKNVYAFDREYNGDYIELIPTSLIDTEDIY